MTLPVRYYLIIIFAMIKGLGGEYLHKPFKKIQNLKMYYKAIIFIKYTAMGKDSVSIKSAG